MSESLVHVPLTIGINKLPLDMLPEISAALARILLALKIGRAAVVVFWAGLVMYMHSSQISMQKAWAPVIYVQYIAYMYRLEIYMYTYE